MSVRGCSQVLRDKVLYKKRDSLDKEVYKCDESTDFYVAERLKHGGKDTKELRWILHVRSG